MDTIIVEMLEAYKKNIMSPLLYRVSGNCYEKKKKKKENKIKSYIGNYGMQYI